MEQKYREKHLLQKLIVLLIAFCAALITTGELKLVNAAEWYTEYQYVKDDNAKTITLKKSNGNLGESAIVPGTTTINGVSYATILDNSSVGNSGFWEEDKDNLKSLTIQSGVKAAAGCHHLFYNLSNLTTLDVSGLDTSAITDMSYMFYHCSQLLYLDLSNFKTGNATSMINMFNGCSRLIYIDISNFDTSKVNAMDSMFGGGFGEQMLQDLDLRSFYLSQGSSTFPNFLTDAGIVNLYLPKTNCIKNYDMSSMSNLARIYFEGTEDEWKKLNNTYKSKVKVIYNYTHKEVPSEPQVSNADSTAWYNNYKYFIDTKNYKLIIMYLINEDLKSAVIPAYTSINGKTYRTVLNNYYARRGTPLSLWANGISSLKDIKIADGVEVVDECSGLFRFNNKKQLTTLTIGSVDTSDVVYMDYMFANINVTSLDLTNMDMSNADTSVMFNNSSITKLYLPVNAMKNYNLSAIEGLTDIYYAGSEAQWTALGNNIGNATITYNYKGSSVEPTTTVTVNFDGNGGTASKTSMNVTPGQAYGTLPTAMRDGYTFEGWYTDKTGGTVVTATTNVSNNSTHTLYAHWTQNGGSGGNPGNEDTITVTYNSNGGNAVSPESVEIAPGGTYGTLPTPSRDGYDFGGWYTDPINGEKVTSSTVLVSNVAHSIFAHWIEKVTTVTVTFNANGGTVTPGSKDYNIGGLYTNLPTPTKNGFSFEGWYTKGEGGTVVTSETTVSETKAHTLYAHWTKVSSTFEVTLNANGGSVSPGTITVEVGKIYSYYTSLPNPTRDGYRFDAWYTEATGGTKIMWSTNVTETKPHTLYARWIANNISVTFNANGGSVTPSTKSYSVGGTYDNIPVPTKDGYDFDGWYTASSGGNKISESDPITQTTSHTLYAHWTAKAITVTFNANGGTASEESRTVTVNDFYGTLPTATKEGYKFKGWFTAAVGGTQIAASSKVSIKSAHTLYAQWTEIKVTVTFNANGGSVSTSSNSVTVGQAYGKLPTPTKTNYRFDGWFTDITDGTKVEADTTVSVQTAHTLYAHWTLTIVKVTFSGNGEGSSVSQPSADVTIGEIYGTLPTAKRDNYDCLGWFTAAEGGDEVTSATIVEKKTAHTLYAHWKKNVITMQVTFNANGGTLKMGEEKKTVTNGQEYGDFPTPTKEGYTFDGWYTSSSGNIKVQETDTVTQTTAHTLYAHWTKDVVLVTVILNPNGGSLNSGDESTKVTYGNMYGTLPKPKDREDYTFDGWFTTAEGGTEIKDTTEVKIQTTHTLYAHWTKNEIEVTVTFAPTGGSVSTTSKNVTYQSAYGTLPTPTRTGYDFVNWYTEINGGTPVKADTLVDQKVSHTLYAHWVEKKVTVSFDANEEGAVIDGDASKEVAVVGKYGTLPSVTMNGFDFEGWYTEKTGGTQVTADTAVVKNIDHTLYAQWTEQQTVDNTKVTVTLNPNGGLLSGKTDKTTIKAVKGAEYGSLPEPVKDGYDFVGWLRKADGTLIKSTTAALSDEHELVAQWTKKVINVNVTYNANGGTITEAGKSVTVGKSYGTLPTPTMSGYIFDGWYTNISEGEAVTETTTVELTSDHTLYARWIEEKKEINVTFNAGEGTVTTLSKTVTYLESYGELPKPTRENCDFIGWFTEAEEGVEITATSKVEISEAHTLYAHWKEKVWVVFNANEGSVDTIGNWVTVSEKYGELPVAVRTDYTFDGWYTEAEGGTEITKESIVTAAGSHTLFAHWTENEKKVTVTFNPNEGTIDANKVSAVVTVGMTYGSLPTVSRDGYEFKGWYTDVESGELITSTNTVKINASHTLYARWYEENKKVTVTFNANGGEVESGKETAEYSVGGYYDNLPTPSKDGYKFEGWYLEPTLETPVNTKTKVELETAHALYASWSEENKTVAVSFNANGGNITTNSMTFKVGDKYENLPTPVMTGYNFEGWFTANEDGDKVTSDTEVKTETAHTLFAHWTAKEKKVTVAFNVNGGALTSAGNMELTVDGVYGKLPVPTKTDCLFDGWYTELEGGDKVTAETKVENENAHSLYAHWIDKITVTLNAAGGMMSVDSFTVTYGGTYDALNSLPKPVKTGCIFEGWYTNPEGGTKINADSEVTLKTSHTIYAHWSGGASEEEDNDGIITVSLNANGGTVTPESITVTANSKYGDLPTPQKEGYTFLGWYNEAGEYIVKESDVKDAYAHSLYALWVDNIITISFNANGGKAEFGSRTLTIGEKYGTLPYPLRAGYIFAGWYTEVVDGEKVFKDKEVTIQNSHTVYAHWIKQEIKTTIHFDATGGNVDETSREVMVGEPYGELPIPTKEGLFFDGWYTEEAGGTKITAESEVDKYDEHTLYAHWTTEEPKASDDPGTSVPQTGEGDPTTDPASQTSTDTGAAGDGGQTSTTPQTTTTGTTTTSIPAVDTVISDSGSGVSYKVSNNTPESAAVVYMGSTNKKAKTVTVPDTVEIDGQTYTVTQVDASAFNNNINATKIIIGKNVVSISKNAFKKCKKVKSIIFKTTKLTNKSVAKGTFKGITKKTVIKVPKKKLSAYKKLFRKKGLSKKVKIKKI